MVTGIKFRHRYPEEHHCCSQNITINKDEDEVRRETKEKVERVIAETEGIIDSGMSAVSVPTKNKVVCSCFTVILSTFIFQVISKRFDRRKVLKEQ